MVLIVMWPLSLVGHAVGLTPSFHQLMNHDQVWEHRHYPLVGLRYLGAFGILIAGVVGLFITLAFLAVYMDTSAPASPRNVDPIVQVENERRIRAQQDHERRRLARMKFLQEEKARRAAEEARERWLAGPAPSMEIPTRFTQAWISTHVPNLHPGQIPIILEELTRRGWSEEDIQRRVAAYLPLSDDPPASAG